MESKDAGVVDSISENEEFPPNSNGPNSSVVVQRAEYVEGIPTAQDLLSCLPEVLVLDANHNPVVQSDVVLAKSILLGAKLKYFPSASCIYSSIPRPLKLLHWRATHSASATTIQLCLVAHLPYPRRCRLLMARR